MTKTSVAEKQQSGIAKEGDAFGMRRKRWAMPRVILSDLRQDTNGAVVSAAQTSTTIGKLS